MSFFRNFKAPALALLPLCSALLMGGCSHQLDQEWMPRGYTNDKITPVTQPPITEPWNDKAVIKDTENMASNTASWQGGVFEVLDKLQPNLPTDGSALYVTPHSLQKENSTQHAFDHFLRQALLQKGMTLTTTAGNGPVLTYTATELTDATALDTAKKEAGYTAVEGASMKGIYLLSVDLLSAQNQPLGHAVTVSVIPHEKSGIMSGWSSSSYTTSGKNPPSYERQ